MGLPARQATGWPWTSNLCAVGGNFCLWMGKSSFRPWATPANVFSMCLDRHGVWISMLLCFAVTARVFSCRGCKNKALLVSVSVLLPLCVQREGRYQCMGILCMPCQC